MESAGGRSAYMNFMNLNNWIYPLFSLQSELMRLLGVAICPPPIEVSRGCAVNAGDRTHDLKGKAKEE